VGPVAEATETSIQAATHLTAVDRGAVEALRTLAVAIDALAATGGVREDGKLDNVSVPTYLKFCESLGLTPVGRSRLPEKKAEAPVGKLALLRGEAAGKRKTAG
jgi:hypothetical protein